MTRSAKQHLPTPRADFAFFLDVDGTLLPIADTPSAVSPSHAVCELLDKLRRASGGAVAAISGRPLEELDQLLCNQHFPAAGQHGAERRDDRGVVTRAEPHPRSLESLREVMRQLANADPRLLMEDKGLSLALHYRRATGYGPELRAKLQRVLDAYPQYVLQTGKQVLEIRPSGISKAHAVEAFMSEAPFLGRVPVFIGDDVTDEDGFATVNRLGGVSIKVGDGDSIALYRLADSEAVLKWLTACIQTQATAAGVSNAQS